MPTELLQVFLESSPPNGDPPAMNLVKMPASQNPGALCGHRPFYREGDASITCKKSLSLELSKNLVGV